MKRLSAVIITFAFVMILILPMSHVSAAMSLTDTIGWTPVYPVNSQFDYVGDQQTGSGSVSQDIVGDQTIFS